MWACRPRVGHAVGPQKTEKFKALGEGRARGSPRGLTASEGMLSAQHSRQRRARAKAGGEKEARVNIRSGRSWTFLTAFKSIIIRFMYEKAALAVLWLMDWRRTKQETT